MAESVLAAVRTGPSRTEIREFPMPDIPADAALMKMEVAGICGTDVKLYRKPTIDEPVIMGPQLELGGTPLSVLAENLLLLRQVDQAVLHDTSGDLEGDQLLATHIRDLGTRVHT